MVTERGGDRALDRPIIFFLPLLLLVLLVLWPGSLAMHRPVYEACSTHIIVPGKKGERGILGETGVPGKPGQIGPSGTTGRTGENGEKGELGRPGKIGPMGAKGDEGRNGEQGLPGVKGERGVPCDCDKMRKVVGELDITVEKLRDQVHFLKSAVVGMIESERRLYLLVREEKWFAEAKKHCQERGGWLAMPHDEVSNELLASYVTRAGLTRVFIGLFDERKEGKFSYVDGSSLGAYSRWQPGEPNNILGNENCVEMMSSGGWNNVDCSQGLYFVCEFEKLDTWVV